MPPVAAIAGEPFYIQVFARVMIFAIAALSLDFILGYGGLVSFGHAAYLGIGAYAVGILAFHGIENGFAHFAAAIAACAVAAAAIGAVSLRTSGVYFIMITLAFAQMVFFLAVGLRQYGGDDGLSIARPSDFGGVIDLAEPWTLYYVVFGFLALFLFLGGRVVRSRFGVLLQGIRSNERRMIALGFPTFRYKLAAFVIAGSVCGVGGALFANLTLFVSPSILHWTRSGEIMMMVILGGIGTLIGPVFGAAAYLLLESLLSRWTEHWPALLGPLLIVIVLGSKSGLLGLFGGRPMTGMAEPSPSPLLATTGADQAVRRAARARRCDAVGHARRDPRDHRSERRRQDDAGRRRWPASCAPMPARSVSPGATFRGSVRRVARRSASRARSRSPRCFANSPRSTMSRWRCRRMPGTASASGARRPATRCCASRPAAALAEVGLAGRADTPAASLSHGERRALELAMVLASEPRLLLLDEPTAGMGAAEVGRDGCPARPPQGPLRDRSCRARHGRGVRAGRPDHRPGLWPRHRNRSARGDPRRSGGASRLSRRRGSGLMLEIGGLEAGYGDGRVLFGVELAIRAGEVVTLLGRNGMGKTTTISAIMGIVRPLAGTVRLDGAEIGGLPPHRIARLGLGLVPEGRQIFPNLTVRENLVATAVPGGRWITTLCSPCFRRCANGSRRPARCCPAASSRCWRSGGRS